MGFISSLIGGINDDLGVQKSNPNDPTNSDQIKSAYDQTQSGISQQQNFVNALQAQNGIGNQSSVFNQMQGVANGTGPNPAQAMLANATGANVANQAALMAGQRGANQNAGLMARQAAMQGANTQQQALGQGAAMQANQSLGALNQMGGIAGQQVNQQANALQGYNQAVQGQQSNLMGAQANFNNSQSAAAKQNNDSNMGMKVIGGALGGLGGAAGGSGGGGGGGAGGGAGAAAMAQGGMVKEPQSVLGRHMRGMTPMADGGMALPGQSNSPTILPVPRDDAPKGGGGPDMTKLAMLAASKGGKVPGKAEVKGNSYSNDKVPAILSPGEVVIPRSVMQGKNPADGAAKFVAAILAKQNMKKK